MIIGRNIFVTPSDSLAVIAANAHLAPGYAGGHIGIARSMPTSRAADRVAEKLGIAMLRDAHRMEVLRQPARCRAATICGEESAGTGSDHVREKDGLWAVLMWLNILAARREPVAADRRQALGRVRPRLLLPPRLRGGRRQGCRRAHCRTARRLASPAGASASERWRSPAADDFAYLDPIDGSHTKAQGIRIQFPSGARIVYRLSGTGTAGATLRVYIERYEPDTTRQGRDTQEVLADLIAVSRDIARITEFTGRTEPSVIT